MNDFNLIASFYGFLSRAVFGDSLIESQTSFSHYFKTESDILILGGGTGKLLELIPQVKSIDYLEKSEKMIERAKRRKGKNSVSFLHEDFLEFQSGKKYNVILCPFFLDCFNETNLKKSITKVKSLLKKDGNLVVSDFEVGSTNRILNKAMHLFFRFTANLESKELKPIHSHIVDQNFSLVEEKFFHKKMIFSRLYRNL